MARRKTPEEKEIASLKKEIQKMRTESLELVGENHSIVLNNMEFFIDPTVYLWFSKTKAGDRKSLLESALNIGLLAKMNGKVSQTLKRFQGELDSEIATIQAYMETFERDFRKDTKLKTDLENEILRELEEFSRTMKYDDKFKNTGGDKEKGNSQRGDVLATIVEDQIPRENLIVEVKFAQSYSIGDKRKVTTKGIRAETPNVYEQVLSSRDNRDSEFAIFVVDKVLNPMDLGGRDIVFIPEINGFIVTVSVESGDYEALKTCYDLARSMTLGKRSLNFDYAVFSLLLQDLNETLNRQKFIREIGESILKTIETNHTNTMTAVSEHLIHFDTELTATKVVIKNTQKLLKKFFEEGTLTAEELYDNYRKKLEAPVYTKAKNDAEQWTKNIIEREKITRQHHLQELKEALQKKPANDQEDTISTDAQGGQPAENDSKSNVQNSSTTSKEGNAPIESGKELEVDHEKMTVAELKELCKEKGLPVGGKKSDLIARLKEKE